MPTEVPALGSVAGVPTGSGAAYVSCGKDGNSIKPNNIIKAQQLTAPDNPSHDIRLNLL